MRLLIAFIFIVLFVIAVYWMIIKPQQISMDCNNFALTQMDNKLTYFRANAEDLNDDFSVAYNACLRENNFEQYSVKHVSNRITEILLKLRQDSDLFQ